MNFFVKVLSVKDFQSMIAWHFKLCLGSLRSALEPESENQKINEAPLIVKLHRYVADIWIIY